MSDDNRSRQLNSNNSAYHSSRGYSETPSHEERAAYQDSKNSYSKEEVDNRSRQLNPNNDAYYDSRGTTKK